MRIYTVHYRPDAAGDDLVLVKEGFCWPAFLLSTLWALWHRLWWVALGLAAMTAAIGAAGTALGLGPVADTALSLGAALIVGFVANDLRRWTLARRGFSDEGVVVGDGEDSALRRFLAHTPALTGDLRP
jgi:hypothetical protein